MIDPFEDHCWKDVMSSDDFVIYESYKRETYVGEKPALIVVDLYNLSFQGGPKPVQELVKSYPSSCGIHAWNAIEPIKELLSFVRSKGIPVIYITRDHKNIYNTGIHSTKRQKNKLESDSYEIFNEFAPAPEDLVLTKERASAFYGTPLVAYLVQMGIKSLIFCGESTSGCVRASVVDAYSNGFDSVVVEECCFDRSELTHKINLFDMHHKYADVMDLEEFKAKCGHFVE